MALTPYNSALSQSQYPHPYSMSTKFPLTATLRFTRLHSIATPFLFILLGVIYASWAARIPAIRDALQLSPSQLGIVLLGLPSLALAPNKMWLAIVAIGLGAGSGCFDVAINAIGTAHEKAAGRSTMSTLHAWFSLGAVSGALLGSAMAGFAITPLMHFSIVSLLLLLPLYIAYQALPPDQIAHAESKALFAVAHGPLVALGIIGFCGAVAEGSIADWSGVFMKDEMGAHDGVAPLAYAGFAALMLLARLVCDRLKDRFGARRVVASGSLFAAFGIFIAISALNIPLTIIGFALAGAGFAAVFPFVFSAAGRHGSTALAAVATFSYSGGLIGPPVIGFLAQGWGMQVAVGLIGVMAIAIAIAASRARWLE